MLLAFAERGVMTMRAHFNGPGDGAAWIWDRDAAENTEPVAFLASGVVHLDTPPAIARLAVVADESYHVYVNGSWVGANRYRRGRPADGFDVAHLLRAGENRVVVEARSTRGVGGLMVALGVGAAARTVLVSDGAWQTHLDDAYDVFYPHRPLPVGTPALVWSQPPAGRWRVPPQPVVRPTLTTDAGQPAAFQPVRARRAGPGARWQRFRRNQPFLPAEVVAPETIFDFGDVVAGYPVVDLRDTRPRTMLVKTALALDDLAIAKATLAVPVRNGRFWLPSSATRFRFLQVQGHRLARPAFVMALTPELASTLIAPPLAHTGVFGLAPLWSPSRAEQQVLDRLRRARSAN